MNKKIIRLKKEKEGQLMKDYPVIYKLIHKLDNLKKRTSKFQSNVLVEIIY